MKTVNSCSICSCCVILTLVVSFILAFAFTRLPMIQTLWQAHKTRNEATICAQLRTLHRRLCRARGVTPSSKLSSNDKVPTTGDDD